jgi:O-antigen ligase
MTEVVLQKTLTRVLAIGAAGVTIFLITQMVTDPVNAPKLFLLGGVAGAAFSLLLSLIRQKCYRANGLEIPILAFILWSLFALFTSDSPVSQGFYGVYGRNTGFLAYLFLSIIAISAAQLINFESIEMVLKGFLIALATNLVYGLWVIIFGDFLGWQNNYGSLLGTFGNPNFISSFLGMGFSLVLAFAVAAVSTRKRVSLLLCLPLIIWQLFEADSLQGIVVALLGTGIVCYFWLRYKTQNIYWSIVFLVAGTIASVTAVIGALGFGPLKHVLAQPTVALREQYWLAAISMANSHPLLGVGMDAYGDWYRRARGSQALITPGPDTVTNVAHNIFLDMLAYGGYPLLLLYLLITSIGGYSILKVIKSHKKYDPLLVGITVLWVGYQAQSVISINQLGLAIWGWLINGLAVAYRVVSIKEKKSVTKKIVLGKNRNKLSVFTPRFVATGGTVFGLLVAVPPLSADMKWRDVQLSGRASEVQNAFQGKYLTPLNSQTMAEVVRILENSKLPDYAITYARKGVKFNPENFEAWRMLYFASQATDTEKAKAKSEMIRLDPLNPSWKELG